MSAFRDQMQAQARHRLQDTKVKAGGMAKSLRDQRHRVNVMGKLGVMHQQFGGHGGPARIIHSMFEHVEGLGEEAKEANKLAEKIYVAAITGDEATLEKALVPLVEKVQAYNAAMEENAAAAAEPPPDPKAKGGKGKAAPEPEPAFDPALGLADAEAEPPRLPVWAVRDARGIEPLALAAARGHAGTMQLLLDAKANVDARATTCGRTALHRAAEEGHLECVTVLVEHGADVLSSQSNGQCALYSACAGGHTAIVEALLAGGAAVEQRDLLGATPLMAACEGGHSESSAACLTAGADVNAADSSGWRALHHATRGGHQGCALALMEAGADAVSTAGGDALRSLNGSIGAQIEEILRERQGGVDDDGEEDDDDDEGDGAGRPFTAP